VLDTNSALLTAAAELAEYAKGDAPEYAEYDDGMAAE